MCSKLSYAEINIKSAWQAQNHWHNHRITVLRISAYERTCAAAWSKPRNLEHRFTKSWNLKMAYQNRQCIRSMETVKLRRTGVCNARPSIFITINPYGSKKKFTSAQVFVFLHLIFGKWCFNEICILFFTGVSVSGADLIPEKPSPSGRRELEIRTWTHGTIKVMKDRYGKNSYLWI